MLKRLLEFLRGKAQYSKKVRSEVEQFKKMARLGQRLIVMEVR